MSEKIENIYECLCILDTAKYNRDPETVSNQISETIESMGGQVRVSRLWEERKLAYEIKKQSRGIYWLTYFRIAPEKVKGLNRQFQINGNILRFLILRIDPRLEQVLVDHALAGPARKDEGAEEAESFEDAPSYGMADDHEENEKNEDNQ